MDDGPRSKQPRTGLKMKITKSAIFAETLSVVLFLAY